MRNCTIDEYPMISIPVSSYDIGKSIIVQLQKIIVVGARCSLKIMGKLAQ